MTLAFRGQAALLFTGWIRSCVSCLSPGEQSQEDQVGLKDEHLEERGVQREMQVCHTQPHLVPPMKLVVYDDLPSPSVHRHRQRNSLSSWVSEGKNLASRASTRASMSWKRSSANPLKIGAPTDFRRVDSFHLESIPAVPKQYQPLQLSIHRSGNRLSDLPSFESFQLDDSPQRQTMAFPPRALTPPGVRARRCQSSHPAMSVSRKPVGSGEPRSVATIEHSIEPPQPVRIASTLVPHFSLVKPVETLLLAEDIPTPFLDRPNWEEKSASLNTESSGRTSIVQVSVEPEPQTPSPKDLDDPNECPFSKDSPSTASSRTMPSRVSSLRRPSTAENRNTIASVPVPALPSRMSQWFFPGKASQSKQVSLAGENGFAWERTRTLSGTTVGSTITTITGGAHARRPNVSISSTFTSSSTPRASLQAPTPGVDKDFETEFGHPTIFEGHPRHYPKLSDPRALDFPRYDGSSVGLAF
ncbi:hypothetical protein N7532_008394 [Penicillium argentinense]|uniref:Uncharacterized protein n=1 Tax=Penicillium argentinense TaxID=1131581 RepID=A0A9W9EXL1_9EURO|nr:uncharacterized protein N7532_008394 [Penicillium argentinense]KAJ5089710.1 hypothetical protein N7532_008394 [Penicillium argentinense]